MEVLVGNDIDPAPQQRLDLVAKTHESKAALSRHVLHQEIDVALGPGVAPGQRAEDADVANAMPFADPAHLLRQGLGQHGSQRGCTRHQGLFFSSIVRLLAGSREW